MQRYDELTKYTREMRSWRFLVMLGSLGAVVVFFTLSCKLVSSPGIGALGYEESLKPTATEHIPKIRQISFRRTDSIRREITNVITHDYPTFDPAPSSKASIQPKPIEHGTPLMPYIPGPTPPPPGPPKRGGSRNP